MPTELILITVKTYPTLSVKYGELVCTAGLRQDGSWIRIYPVPFRQLEAYQKFPKYSFIEAEVVRNTKDARPESHKVNTDTLNLTGEVDRRTLLELPQDHQLSRRSGRESPAEVSDRVLHEGSLPLPRHDQEV